MADRPATASQRGANLQGPRSLVAWALCHGYGVRREDCPARSRAALERRLRRLWLVKGLSKEINAGA